jgi:cell division protein FtsW
MKTATSFLVFSVASLLALSMVMLFSSSMGQAESKFLLMQPLWCGVGLLTCVAAASGDYRWLRRVSWVLLGVAIVLLALVFISPVGLRINGASRWLGYHSFRLQPSEFAKLALILVLAHYGEYYQRHMATATRGFAVPVFLIASVLVLVFAEPDWGTSLLLAGVSAVILFVAGTRLRYFIISGLAGLTALALGIAHNPMRWNRLLAFLHPEDFKEGFGYQAWQAKLAFGAGGWTGLGLGNGRQKLGFVPEHHTDFIYSVLGEELGLIACLLVLLAYFGIVLCGLYIACRARDTFGRLLSVGITFLIGMQAAINIGVVTSSLPNKGLSLPFLSYGGSNLVIMLAGVGLLLNVARHAVEPAAEVAPAHEPEGVPAPQLS